MERRPQDAPSGSAPGTPSMGDVTGLSSQGASEPLFFWPATLDPLAMGDQTRSTIMWQLIPVLMTHSTKCSQGHRSHNFSYIPNFAPLILWFIIDQWAQEVAYKVEFYHQIGVKWVSQSSMEQSLTLTFQNIKKVRKHFFLKLPFHN